MVQQGYGAREVPNIELVFLDKGTQVYTLYINTVCRYYEDNQANDKLAEIEWALINPKDYEFITAHQYTEILMYRAQIIRSSETGEDEVYFPPTMCFHNAEFEYRLETNGDPSRWTLVLRG